jgi:hypothetical protein
MFPSPCGVNIVANRFIPPISAIYTDGFRPLAGDGFYYQTEYASLSVAPFTPMVSVPLRGKYRGEAFLSDICLQNTIPFPSPYGVNIVAKPFLLSLASSKQRCFRPLTG